MSPDDSDPDELDDAAAREQLEALAALTRENGLRLATLHARLDGREAVAARIREETAQLDAALEVARRKSARLDRVAGVAIKVCLATSALNVASVVWRHFLAP